MTFRNKHFLSIYPNKQVQLDPEEIPVPPGPLEHKDPVVWRVPEAVLVLPVPLGLQVVVDLWGNQEHLVSLEVQEPRDPRDQEDHLDQQVSGFSVNMSNLLTPSTA